MILDSSAIIAMYLEEPGHEKFDQAVDRADVIFVGAPTVLETVMVLSARTGEDAWPGVMAFLHAIAAEVVPFTERHAQASTAAFLRYGRGNHPARLNFGDCMSYAIASESGLPLLFKGDDFARTDVRRA